jgi:hypothetical protein
MVLTKVISELIVYGGALPDESIDEEKELEFASQYMLSNQTSKNSIKHS